MVRLLGLGFCVRVRVIVSIGVLGEDNKEDAVDRSTWRKQIGMIVDHDDCEWVNVSSGTGSPGLSRTNSIEP